MCVCVRADRVSRIAKRYGDFKKLHPVLQEIADRNGIPLPPLPKGGLRKYFSRNSAKVVQERMASFQQLLDVLVRYTVLYRDPAAQLFLKQ
jgi:hypothetical protein